MAPRVSGFEHNGQFRVRAVDLVSRGTRGREREKERTETIIEVNNRNDISIGFHKILVASAEEIFLYGRRAYLCRKIESTPPPWGFLQDKSIKSQLILMNIEMFS